MGRGGRWRVLGRLESSKNCCQSLFAHIVFPPPAVTLVTYRMPDSGLGSLRSSFRPQHPYTLHVCCRLPPTTDPISNRLRARETGTSQPSHRQQSEQRALCYRIRRRRDAFSSTTAPIPGNCLPSANRALPLLYCWNPRIGCLTWLPNTSSSITTSFG